MLGATNTETADPCRIRIKMTFQGLQAFLGTVGSAGIEKTLLPSVSAQSRNFRVFSSLTTDEAHCNAAENRLIPCRDDIPCTEDVAELNLVVFIKADV